LSGDVTSYESTPFASVLWYVALNPLLPALQLTATLLTSAEPIVPLPLATLQVWPAGFVLTVTA
jgi:hypothetical protein